MWAWPGRITRTIEAAMALLVLTKIMGQRGSCKVLVRDWRIVSLGENEEITFVDLFKGILACQFDAHDTFLLPM